MLDGQRAALVLLSAVGDVVHALPLVASLKAAMPRARIEWVVQPGPGEIASRHPAVDRVWLLERHRGWRGFRDLRRALRGERFDVVLDLQVYAKASLVTRVLESPRKIGFDRGRARELNWLVTNERITPRAPQHICDQYLEFADHLGVARRYEWALPLDELERADQARLLADLTSPAVAFVIGTSQPDKEWKVERWAELADRLHERWGYTICLLGRDRERAAEILRMARCPIRDEQRDDLRRLVWLLDAAALVVSPDTGPYHIAVALDVPTIGLFGATDPARHGPGRRFLELVVDHYHAPGDGWHPPSEEWRANRMDQLAVEEVVAAVDRARERYPRAVVGPVRGAIGS